MIHNNEIDEQGVYPCERSKDEVVRCILMSELIRSHSVTFRGNVEVPRCN